MVNYLSAEFYKVFHRKYFYLTILVMLLCEGLLVAGWVYTNANGGNFGFAVGATVFIAMLMVGLYSTILVGDIVFSEQYKFGTIKNEVSYGLSRTRIFLGKLIVQCGMALLMCVLFVAFYLGLCYALLPHDPAADGEAMRAVGYSLLAVLPLWLGAQALVNTVFFLIKSSTVGSFLIVGLFMGAGQVFKLIGILGDSLVNRFFYGLYRVMLSSPFDYLSGSVGDTAFLGQTAAIGGVWFVLAVAVGLLAWKQKEIN